MEFSFSPPPLDLEEGGGKKRKERVAFEENHPQSITVGLIASGLRTQCVLRRLAGALKRAGRVCTC